MKEKNKTSKKINAKKNVKLILEKQLHLQGSGAGSIWFYQPKEPSGMEKYKKC